ncbi:extracellular solute-binding protein [Paenibacillus mesophilus]|uniref:ABC transporter substrate-binding protein n=1 Tax=Paenibacillus mesophilus TaxID=2582849 RepID=UPI00110D7D9D|nr:extracellular solute-binding protein [Paenibacillus mesophilus]TMV50039.1 extracellular solute-binding protein [Paenibacillus mesophilus]
MRKRWKLAILSMSITALLAGCSGGQTSGSEGKKQTEAPQAPVKLIVYTYSSSLTDAEFQQYFVEPVQRKYPHISFTLINRNGDENTPEKLMATGTYPDILLVSNIYIGMFNQLGMNMDLSEMVQKTKMNVSKFDPGAMDAIRQFGTKSQLFAIPFSMNYGMTAYNKDIFDQFGVSYPKDKMTWNEMLDLGKKLTRKEKGISYIGIDPGPVDQMKEQYSLPYVDEKQEKPVINTDGYQKLFSLLKQFYEVPGYIGDKAKFDYGRNAFVKDRNLAMLPTWGNGVLGTLEETAQQGVQLNWDLVTQPVFADRPDYGRPANMPVFMVFPKSPNKDAAFRVIETLVSDEVQTALNKKGRLTVLNDENIKKQFASELKSFQGKNVQAVFKLKQAPGTVLTDYDVELKKIVQEAAKDMAQNGKDVNTALREAQDKAVKKMAELKSK